MRRARIAATILMAILIVGTIFVMAFEPVTPETSGGITLGPLESQWDDRMVAGVSGEYLSGRKSDYTPTRSWETAEGSPILGSGTTEGISIVELDGARWLGLFRGAGWTLSGVLLGRIHVGDEQLELYGKRIVRWNGGFLGFDTYHREEDERYEFFLLHRTGPNTQAQILKRWEIAPNNVARFPRRPSHSRSGLMCRTTSAGPIRRLIRRVGFAGTASTVASSTCSSPS